MALNYKDLDSRTRHYLIQEFDRDAANGLIYLSPRLTDAGRLVFPGMLRVALSDFSDAWLEEHLANRALMRFGESRQFGERTIKARIPYTAARTLSEGEFNLFYMRGLCRRAIREKKDVIVYRAKHVEKSRTQSMELLGSAHDPEGLLSALRRPDKNEEGLLLPLGPNSGISLMLERDSRSSVRRPLIYLT